MTAAAGTTSGTRGGRPGLRRVVVRIALAGLEPDYGDHVWIGAVTADDRTEPYVARDMFYLDGAGKQRVDVIPSRRLVIVRVAENGRDWDEAFLPNTLVRGLATGRRAAERTPHGDASPARPRPR